MGGKRGRKYTKSIRRAIGEGTLAAAVARYDRAVAAGHGSSGTRRKWARTIEALRQAEIRR